MKRTSLFLLLGAIALAPAHAWAWGSMGPMTPSPAATATPPVTSVAPSIPVTPAAPMTSTAVAGPPQVIMVGPTENATGTATATANTTVTGAPAQPILNSNGTVTYTGSDGQIYNTTRGGLTHRWDNVSKIWTAIGLAPKPPAVDLIYTTIDAGNNANNIANDYKQRQQMQQYKDQEQREVEQRTKDNVQPGGGFLGQGMPSALNDND